MIDNNSLEPDQKPVSGASTSEDQRRLLELELIKLQSEASAARLEARAAEIELMIRQLGSASSAQPSSSGTTSSGVPINRPHIEPRGDQSPAPAPLSVRRFDSWEAVRAAPSFSPARGAPASARDSLAAEPAVTRIDAAEHGVTAPHFAEDLADVDDVEKASIDGGVAEQETTASSCEVSLSVPLVLEDDAERAEPVTGEVAIESEAEAEEDEQTGRRPAAWLVSAAAHVVVLLILAMIGLKTQRPKDQIALAASAVEANEVSMETFSIEADEPVPEEVTEPTPSETEYELSPVGQIAASDFALDAPPAPPSPAAAAMSSSAMTSSAAMAVKTDSSAKMQFCGVEGGGNHFVYLVDSSKSMRDGFESARAELLASIDILKPDQRFYVVFFDEEPDYMRLSNPGKDEPSSVYATTENKASLRRWAMRIAKNDGRAPYDPLEFALELKPDVIFLLSDGEFPQGIEDLLREQNKVENLFGDEHPISIVHTIGYHSKAGESRMRRIAQQNKGQYRYIPKP